MKVRIEHGECVMNIFILTGAGLSADSGLRTFRDNETGIWEGEKISEVCVAGCFEKNPDQVNAFYNKLREGVDTHVPNAAHHAISEYINKTNNKVMMVTQNIDNYHELTGSKPVKMHGDLYKMYCVKCGEYFHVDSGYIHDIDDACTFCGETKSIRPDVVFFGEGVHIDEGKTNKFLTKDENSERLSYFIAIGTSGNVYPAAGFAKKAHFHSNKVYINLTEDDKPHIFNQKRIGRAVDTVPKFFEELYDKHG